jgi:hypothetical protein
MRAVVPNSRKTLTFPPPSGADGAIPDEYRTLQAVPSRVMEHRNSRKAVRVSRSHVVLPGEVAVRARVKTHR